MKKRSSRVTNEGLDGSRLADRVHFEYGDKEDGAPFHVYVSRSEMEAQRHSEEATKTLACSRLTDSVPKSVLYAEAIDKGHLPENNMSARKRKALILLSIH